jgi:hypothetical protein
MPEWRNFRLLIRGVGSSPTGGTQQQQGFQAIEALFYFRHLHTICIQFEIFGVAITLQMLFCQLISIQKEEGRNRENLHIGHP